MSALDWTERGRELGATLGDVNAIVVVGEDPIATAEVALGIARVQAADRRVAIGDLIGDVAPLQSLVTSDDPHGIVDSFVFGVSLNKIAHAVADSGQLFIMPTGSSPIEHEELLPDPRWKRLSGEFRLEGALLILVAPTNAARLPDLVATTDGIVIVGDAVPAEITVAQSLAWLRPKKSGRTTIASSAPLAVVEAARVKPKRDRKWIFASAAGLVIVLALTATVLYLARPSPTLPPKRATSKTTPQASSVAPVLSIDTTARSAAPVARPDSGASAVVDAFAATSALVIGNPLDSARASAWAVLLVMRSTQAAAIMDLRGRFENVPAGTYGFDPQASVVSLVAGAYPSRASADSLVVQLRNAKILAPGTGTVTSLPFAFLVQAQVPEADVSKRLSGFAGRGLPVYALRQANRSGNLYFGAYESARQAALAAASVRAANLTPTLVYRIGRVF